jgi:hypothetical protein
VGCPSRISAGLREWQAEWSGLREVSDRQTAAVRTSALAVAALQDHSRAYRRNLNSHTDGVTVVVILRLLDHLRLSTGLDPDRADVAAGIDDIFDLIPAVRIAARAALDQGYDAAGAHGTLGELYLVSGDQASANDREVALSHYAEARVSGPERDALLERLRLFDGLGFRPGLVAGAILTLQS